ncbi:hypothetical protein BH20ACI4_BH20ACI4_02310 [soil metagenome]
MDKRLQLVSAILTVVLSTVISVSANIKVSDDNVWREIDDSALKNRPAERLVEPNIYRTFQINKSALQTILDKTPMEDLSSNRTSQTILTLPLPDGTFSRFRILESPIMEEGLAVKYPHLKTYIAQGIDVPTATARISYTPTGFRAMILSGKGSIMIDPYAPGDTDNYISYAKSDVNRENLFVCEFEDQMNFYGDNYKDMLDFGQESESVISGSTLRTYRLALAATGDYTGDGKADIAFWRPSNGNWTILRSEDLSFFAFPWGASGDTPAPGDYDGDGKFDAAVYRPTGSTWFIQRTTAGNLIQGFGQAGDVPLPSVYIP